MRPAEGQDATVESIVQVAWGGFFWAGAVDSRGRPTRQWAPDRVTEVEAYHASTRIHVLRGVRGQPIKPALGKAGPGEYGKLPALAALWSSPSVSLPFAPWLV